MKLRQRVKQTAAWMLLSAFAWTACFASAEEIGEALIEQPLQEEQTEASPDDFPPVEENGEEVLTIPETTTEPIPDEWSDTVPEPTPPEEEWEEELPENDSAEDEWSEDEAEPEAPMEEDGAFPLDVRDVIDTQFFAYVQTMVPMGVSFDRDQNDTFFVLDEGSILLTDLYTENCVQAWFVTQEGELKTGFVPLEGLLVLTNEIAEQMEGAEMVETMAGMMPAFFVSGMALIPDEGERDEQDAADPDELPEETTMQPEETELSGLLSGDFVKVTPFTRAYSDIDESADTDELLFDGYFVSDASVRIETVAQDGQDRDGFR